MSSRLVCDTCSRRTEKTLRLCDTCIDAGARDCDSRLLRALKVAYHSMQRGDESGSPARTGALEQARQAIVDAGGES